MISSFFDNTKPINFLVLMGFVLLLFWGVTIGYFGLQWEYGFFFGRLLSCIPLVLSVFVLGNMVKAQKLTLDNSYAMLFFALLVLLFFNVTKNSANLFCYFFVLVSCERALSLRQEKRHKEKVFEAALCIFAASLFMDWALLYLIPLYLAISLFCGKQLRLWLMPIAAATCVAILSIAVAMILKSTDFFASHYSFSVDFHFFRHPNYGLLLYSFFALGMVFLVFGKLGYRRLGRTLALRLIFAYLIIAILLLLFSSGAKEGAELLSFLPTAIFMANYLETIKKNHLKEALVIVSIALPFLGLVLRLLQ